MLNREAILAAQDLTTQDVDVPEWGGAVRVRTMSLAERNAFGASVMVGDKVDQQQYAAQMLIRCIVGEDNQPLFTSADLEALGAKSAIALRRVFEAADKLNTVTVDQIETAEKN